MRRQNKLLKSASSLSNRKKKKLVRGPTFWMCVAGHVPRRRKKKWMKQKRKTNDEISSQMIFGINRRRRVLDEGNCEIFVGVFQDAKRTVTVSKAWLEKKKKGERKTGCHQELIQASWVVRPRRLQASKQRRYIFGLSQTQPVVVLVFVVLAEKKSEKKKPPSAFLSDPPKRYLRLLVFTDHDKISGRFRILSQLVFEGFFLPTDSFWVKQSRRSYQFVLFSRSPPPYLTQNIN